MTLAEQMAADITTVFNTEEFGEAAVYNGTPIVVVEAEAAERNSGTPGFAVPLFAIYVKASDVPRPVGGDVVTFRGFRCTATQFPTSEGGGIWRVELLKDTIQA
jgi:hypothetical protein